MSNQSWITEAMAKYERALLAYAMRLVRDRERARDVVQDTFLRLCRQPREKVEENLGAWLYRVCRNRAFDSLRKGDRMKTLNPDMEQTLPAEATSPARQVETEQQLTTALQFLARLPENQQEVIRLKLEHELSYREISEVTGLSVSNVGFLIHTGLKTIRQRLVRHNRARPKATLRRIK